LRKETLDQFRADLAADGPARVKAKLESGNIWPPGEWQHREVLVWLYERQREGDDESFGVATRATKAAEESADAAKISARRATLALWVSWLSAAVAVIIFLTDRLLPK
jgi:hypothetical protein